MISIPYGKLFYLQAACQTKQQKQKSSSALGRNKILKTKVRTQHSAGGEGGVKSISDICEDWLTTQNGMWTWEAGRRGRSIGK